MVPGKTVLLVEDSDDDVLIVQRGFRVLKLPHELTVSRSGEDAWTLFQDASFRPDIVLLDLNLPRMSGIELLRRIKAQERLRHIPIIVLSASDRESDISGAYAAGANHYLVKPIRFEAFVELLRRWNDYWIHAGRLPPRA